MTRVVVVAPSAVVRAGLEVLLRTDPELEVVGSRSSLADLAQDVERLDPDVILLEPSDRSPLRDSRDRAFLPAEDSGPPLVLLIDGDAHEVTEALRSGARAVLQREAEAPEIIAAVRAAAAGLVVLPPQLLDEVLPAASPAPREGDNHPVEALTPREIEVLSMLAEGEGNKQIARRLGISEHTVKFHVGSIMAKLGASSRTEAVTVGVRHGLIML